MATQGRASAGRCVWGATTLLVVLCAGREARAHNTGISSVEFANAANGCLNCHGGGTAPAVTLTPSKTALAALEQLTFDITVTTPNTFTPAGGVATPGAAGFNLRANKAGTFAPGSSNTRTIAGPGGTSEATHTQRTEGEPAVFSVRWTPAAGVTGDVVFTLWGNAVNENGNNQGDLASTTTRTVTVAAACTLQSFYRDTDADGFGAGTPTSACTAPTGFVAASGDCNDAAAGVHPGAPELCNGVDDNCSGSVDEGLALTAFYPDADSDGFGSAAAAAKMACSVAQAGAGYVTDHTDCNDGNAAVKPTAVELCNGVDDNCSGSVDEGLALTAFYPDADSDGFGSAAAAAKMACSVAQAGAGYVTDHTDCNDGNAAVKPTAVELCNGVDDNCAGGADEGFGVLTCGVGACRRTISACLGGAPQVCAPGVAAAETCNGVDDDCDGVVDDGDVCRDAGQDASVADAGGKAGAGGGGSGAAGGGAGGAGGVVDAGGGGVGGGGGGAVDAGRGDAVDAAGGGAGTGGAGTGGAGTGGTGGAFAPDASAAGGAAAGDAGPSAAGAGGMTFDASGPPASKDASSELGTLPVTQPGSNDGCSCHLGPAPSSSGLLSLVSLTALALWLRRRR